MQAFIVIQDKEIVRYRLRDYFGSSFLAYEYRMFDYNRDHPRNFTDKQLVYITEPYSLHDRKIFPSKETITPRKNSAKLLKIHEKNNLERIFLFYINEAYEAKIVDLTMYENKKVDEVYSNNLMPIFIKFLSNIKCEQESKHCSENKSYTIRDIYCDGLSVVLENRVLILPCRTEDDFQFITWFILGKVTDSFSIKIYLELSKICIDPFGKQIIAAFQHGTYVYITTSAYFYPDYLCVDIYDLAQFEKGKIKYVNSSYYTSSDFTKDNSEMITSYNFNLRDSVFFNVGMVNEKGERLDQMQHYLVSTCYNNGLLFFTAINLYQSTNETGNNDIVCFTYENQASLEHSIRFNSKLENGKACVNWEKLFYKKGKPNSLRRKENNVVDIQKPPVMYFRLNFIYKVKNLGRIFIESESSNEYSKMTFFSSTSSPPVVYEFAIDEYLNVNTKKIYEIKNEDPERYTGNDMITVTKKFIAFLVFDNKLLRQSIRILYRDETNFAIGHTHILLDDHKSEISTIKFLCFKSCNMIYVRNTEQWSIFEIKDIELVIDTFTNNTIIFDYIFQTFEIKIDSFNENNFENQDFQLTQNFNITFTDPTDLDIYYIGRSTSEVLKHSYGSNQFKLKINDYYMGPNMAFGYLLNSSFPYGSNIYLPQILNKIIEEPKTFKISREYDCLLYHISIALDQTAFGTIVSLYCIQSNFIEHIIYREIDQSILSIERIEYPNSQFIDGFVTIHSQKYSKYDFIFAVLSHEKSDVSANYTVHIFDIDKDKIFWIDKFTIETLNNKLRKYNPLIPIFATNVMVFVDESEKVLYVVSENPKLKNYVLRTTKRVMHVYPVFDDQLYISHYNDTEVSVYKLYNYQEDSSRINISIEFIRMQNFTQFYCGFDIDNQGKVLVFSKPNIILVYQIKTIHVMSYLKRLNFFKYMKEFTYTTNDYENGIVYNFYDNFLYLIMVNMTDTTEKALFIFDYTTNSHNSLKTVLKLDRKYYKDRISISIELFNIGSTTYSYLFFEGKEFKLIKFESDNVLIPIKYSSYLFLPKDFTKYSSYKKSNVSLSIFPLIVDREFSSRNTTLNLLIQSQNYGLTIESRSASDLVYYGKDQSLNLSLLDYFDGFDLYYEVNVSNSDAYDDKIITEQFDDTVTPYIIDAVTSKNSTVEAIMIDSKYMLLFFSQNHLMQVYEVTDEIRKVGIDYNYFDLFHECEAAYINFVKLQRDYSFLIVQCVEVTEYIDASYVLKFFTIDITNEYEVKVQNITSIRMNRKAKDVQVVNSPLAKDDLYVVILTNDGIDNDSIIYFVSMKCVQNYMDHAKTTFEVKKSNKDYFSNINSQILKCELNQYDIYSGLKLNLDQFVVNSFMFINNEPLFVVSVDNFGLLVIDIVSKSIVDKLSFTEMIENFPNEFMITKIFPIEKNGIRILIEDHGEFSLFWKRIAKIGDQDHVFVELKVLEYQISLTKGVIYYLLDYSNEGYSRIILKEARSNEYYLAFVQIYFNFYHENSKKSKEIILGYVPFCEFISQDFTQYRIVVICGSKAYLIFISIYPSLLINQNSMQRELNVQISTFNEASFKQLNIHIKNVGSKKLLPNWIVGICFISLIFVIVLFVPYAFNFCCYSKEKKSIPKLLKPTGSYKGLLKHETAAGVVHRLQQSNNLEKNKTRLIIEKEKGILKDSLQPGSNDISSKIRNNKQNHESSEENFKELKIKLNQNENKFMDYPLYKIQEESDYESNSSFKN